KEGILMWNGAFGLNVIRAERAPVDAIIGDPRYNMVQWVDRDWGPAYADLMQYHPLTGEVLHANVFFPSLFAVVGQKDAKQLLEKIQSDPLSFQKRGFCQRDESHSLDEFARMVVEGSISEESVLRLSKRYVRSIVAHEIGHTLGLKHNFKGNLGSAFSLEANAENVKAWLEEDLLDSTLPSSSIMDYQLFEDEIRMHSVGSYDKAAIRYLYQARPLERESLLFPPFCTDTDVGSDVFCLRWDTSSDPLRWEIGKMKNDLESGSIASLGGQMTESLRFFNEKQTGFYSKNGAFLSGIYDLTDLYVKILSENIPSHQGLRVKILETLLQGNPPFSLLKIQGTGDRIITLIVDWISSTTDSKEMRLMAVEALLGLEDGDLKDFGNLVAEQNLWKNILDFQQSLNRAKNAEEKEKLEKSLASEQALLDFLSKPTPVIVTEQSPQ
ncbi:MAG: zinc-dependent metalloprotease, partial [Deltaproteobacteria bacterium]|nr:zinc-dependent metalloprotease [Deltaproteobacteria bacterium]